jgi:hypothetical protein
MLAELRPNPIESGVAPRPTPLDAPTSAALAEQLAARAERVLGVRLHAEALALGPLPDAKRTFVLREPNGVARAVAQCSSPIAPDMVERGVERADAVREEIAFEQRSVVLEPLARGMLDGLSYAIWPYRMPLTGRGARFVARRLLVTPMLSFLRTLARDTQRPLLREASDRELDRALCAQATDVRLPAPARLGARDALRRLDRGALRPMQVAMHGDLHLGNVLLDPMHPQGFVLIDWCGASTQGWPLFDLMRAAESLQVSNRRLHAELSAHCELLRGDASTDIVPASEAANTHLTLGLAMLGAELEHFPFERYTALLERMYARLDAAHQAGARDRRGAGRALLRLEERCA